MIKRTIRISLFVLYLLILFRITVFRSGWYSHGFFSGTLVWVPFQTIFGFLKNGYTRLFIYLFFGNILWFAPFGACLYLHGLPAWKSIVLTTALSVLIETLQFVFGCGWTEAEDVILNTVGGALGCAFAALYQLIRNRSANRKIPSE